MPIKRLASTIQYFRTYPRRVKPFLPSDAFLNPPEIYTGPHGNFYEKMRFLFRRMGLLPLARRLIGLRLIMSARHFFAYSPDTPTDAHFRYEVRPYSPEQTQTSNPDSKSEVQAANGVNVIGYLSSSKGLGQSARNLLQCLSSAAIPVSAYSIDERDETRMPGTNARPTQIYPQYPISILGINADQSLLIEDLLGSAFYKDHYNIGYWYWETASFPERWKHAFDLYDEIWVASTFVQQTLQTQTQKSVYRFPLPINIHVPSDISRSQLGLPDKQFIVLFVFDALSVVGRKNPSAVLRAYAQAFSALERQSSTKLILKVNNLDKLPVLEQQLRAEISQVEGILLGQPMDRTQIDALLSICDVYISLHRSEGFGLTLAEAMALGKPVIGTAYSGNLDFMREDNSYLVPFHLIDIPDDSGLYASQGLWADANIDAAATMLRDIYLHRDLATEKGHRAAQFIHEHYNVHITGQAIAARLDKIRGTLGASKPLL